MKDEAVLFIVDSDPTVQAVAQSIARAEGIPTERFTEVDEFVRSDFADRPGCILIAVDLAGLSGIDVLARQG